MSTPTTQLNLAREGVEKARVALQADGADLELQRVEGEIVYLKLILGDEACLECIMPKSILEEILLLTIKETAPEVRAVNLDDPREDPA